MNKDIDRKIKVGRNILLGIVILFICSCKIPKSNIEQGSTKEKKSQDTIVLSDKEKGVIKNALVKKTNFKAVLNTVKDIKHTKEKHKDWMSNRARTLDSLFLLNNRTFLVKTTSYEYKNKLKFYLHNIKHRNDSISIKPFIENAQGKRTRGYTGERVLIFTMLNDKEANFIDIPANWNHMELKEELLDILYEKINSDVILCYRTKKCVYKDFREKK
ncbi:hypothetical protein [Tenacibaculum sp. SDUM215027]|uniref:hypothetical protein n=1 Tax=Tenacibaculum sp. SDUM215027 TaxID=3422596 RepID=UPI003D31E137